MQAVRSQRRNFDKITTKHGNTNMYHKKSRRETNTANSQRKGQALTHD